MFGFGRRHGRFENEAHGRCGDRGPRERMHRDDGGMGGWMSDRGFGRGRGGGPMGRGRFFDHGDLKLLILALVAESPRHGYEIIKAIEEKAGGAYSPSPGVVYPTLTMLEDLGFITIEPAAGNRKLCQVTEAGTAYLKDNEPEVKVILARMAAFDAANAGGRSPQLMRAMQNMMMAMRLKLASGALSAEQINTITAALDEAAQKIERS